MDELNGILLFPEAPFLARRPPSEQIWTLLGSETDLHVSCGWIFQAIFQAFYFLVKSDVTNKNITLFRLNSSLFIFIFRFITVLQQRNII